MIKKLFTKSLKPIETEEPLDLFIIRPIAFLLVILLKPLPVSPNTVTIISMISGIFAGYFFAQVDYSSILYGALFLIGAHTLDCVDGQLARIRGTSSRLGKTLDGIADVVTYISIFSGVAISMTKQSSSDGWIWWVYAITAGVNYLIHINLYDHFKNELIHYAIPTYHDKLESLNQLKKIYKKLGNSIKARGYKFFLLIYIGFYIVEETVIQLAQPKKYRGYLDWYQKNDSISKNVKENFRLNYKRYNWLLVRGWSLLGAMAHITVFLVTALFNRMDLVFWIICVPFNIWTIFLVICQHIMLQHQMNAAYKYSHI